MLHIQGNLGGWGRVDALDLLEEQIHIIATLAEGVNSSGNATAIPIRSRITFGRGAARAHAAAQTGPSQDIDTGDPASKQTHAGDGTTIACAPAASVAEIEEQISTPATDDDMEGLADQSAMTVVKEGDGDARSTGSKPASTGDALTDIFVLNPAAIGLSFPAIDAATVQPVIGSDI